MKCGARTRAGGQCKRLAMLGQSRCDFHGGKSPQALRKAKERLATATARKVLADLDVVEPITDPFAALENLAGECVKLCDVLRGCVADLEQIRYAGGLGQGVEQIRGELSAYLSALARAESSLATIVKLDLEGRRLRLQEADVKRLVGALNRMLAHPSLGLTEDQQKSGVRIMAAELKAPAAAAAIEVGR